MKSLIRKEVAEVEVKLPGETFCYTRYETRLIVLGLCIYSRSIPVHIANKAPHLL